MIPKSPFRGIDREILQHIIRFEARKFTGRGTWIIAKAQTLEEARSLREALGPQTQVVAIGWVPSRGPGIKGSTHIPDWVESIKEAQGLANC